MGTLSALEIGKRALIAQRFGLDVTSNNIANVNTAGYSRRTATLSETEPVSENGKYTGTGVTADSLRSFRLDYFDKEIRNTSSRQSCYEADEELLSNVETALSEPSELGFTELATQFFDTFNQLAQTPENVGLRQNAIEQAKSLAERFNSVYNTLQDARADSLKSLNSDVGKVNALFKDIASLNSSIAATKNSQGDEVQSYVDEREKKLEELSKLININTGTNDDGTVNVFVNGINFVTASYSAELKATETVNQTTGEKGVSLSKYDPARNSSVAVEPASGETASLLKTYNVTLDEKESGSDYSITKKLNEFAAAIAGKVNNLAVKGYGLDDKGTTPPGRFIFDPAVGEVTAGNIAVSEDIKNDPRNLPLSDAAGEGGNGSIALGIGRIADDNTFLDGMKPASYYSGFIAKIGTMLKDATNGKSTTTLVANQLEKQRESNIGVNLDEEAVNLIKFQKAFEAASRVVNTTNEILSTIVNLGQ